MICGRAVGGAALGVAARRLAVTAMLAASACAKVPEQPLRVAISPWPGYVSLHLAQSLSYVSPERVSLVTLRNNAQSLNAMRAGTVDAATTTLDEALLLLQEGMDVRVVLVLDRSVGGDVVMAGPRIATLAQLRGTRIGFESAAVGAVMLDALLSAAHLTPSDVIAVPLAVNLQEEALAAGRVDAVVTYEPVRSRLLAKGAHVLFDSRQIPDRIVDVLVVRASALPEHAVALRALVAAHFKALEYFGKQPDDAAVRLAPYLGVSASDVRPQFEGIRVPSIAENYESLAGESPRLHEIARDLGALMLRQRLLQQRVPINQLADPSFLPTVAP